MFSGERGCRVDEYRTACRRVNFRRNAHSAVIEQLFQPAIADGGLELEFSAEMQDRDLIKQMTAENGYLSLR
jgi:hypothetical protein